MEIHARRVAVLILTVGGALLSACERSPQPPPKPPATRSADRVALPAEKANYSFAPGVTEAHSEVVGFLRQFLETCLAGDYSGYRRLVARTSDPQSKARFERILHALKSLVIESIDEVELREVPPPVYLAIGKADFVVERKGPPRHGDTARRIGILVLREDGEWRVALAPDELQPGPTSESSSAPATSTAPSYPWDEDGE